MKILKQFHLFLRNNRSTVVLWLFVLAFLEVFSVYFISYERYEYVWDYAAYYDKYIFLGDLAKTGALNFIQTVYESFTDNRSYLI